MSLSERILGKPSSSGRPRIDSVQPSASLPGGEVRILGAKLKPQQMKRPTVDFAGVQGTVVVSSEEMVIARVPEGASSGALTIQYDSESSNPIEMKVGASAAESLHLVANPAMDANGNLFATFSGSRGQKVPVSVFRIEPDFTVKPFLTDLMNPTSIAFDKAGLMYISSRMDGTVYRVAANGTMATYAEGLGTATGIAFDKSGNLYVGDRSGTIFKIDRNREMFVFATLEPSVSAYHLAVGANGDLFVTGPTTSSFDAVYRITPQGEVTEYYRGLGRPQGMAFDTAGNLYVCASWQGRRGIMRISPEREVSVAVAGNNIVGLAFSPDRSAYVATGNAVYFLDWGVQGMPLFG